MNVDKDAVFAGRLFVPVEQNGYHFFLWGNVATFDGRVIPGQIRFSHMNAEPAKGAFLSKIKGGWIFVVGVRQGSPWRHTFNDTSPQADENAKAMQRLGIPVLSIKEGNLAIKADRMPLHSVTADEESRAIAIGPDQQ